MRFARALVAGAFILAPGGALAAQSDTAARSAHFLKLGHQYVQWMLLGKTDSLATAFDKDALQRMGGLDSLKQHVSEMFVRAGFETELVEEKMTRRHGLPQFWHEGKFTTFKSDNVVIRFLLDSLSGKIVGVGMGPKSAAPVDN